jgi:nucleoside phosphorylase
MANLQIDVAILFALKEEFELLFEQVKNSATSYRDSKSGQYDYIFEFPFNSDSVKYRCLATFSNEMGPTAAAIMVERVIQLWNPLTFAFVGIAGGVSDEVQLGDVVVATQVDDYLARAKAIEIKGRNKSPVSFSLTTAGEVYRPDAMLHRVAVNFEFAQTDTYDHWRTGCADRLKSSLSSDDLSQLSNERSVRSSPIVATGHIASGPIVSASEGYQHWLKQRDRSVLCLEMESAGFLAAIYNKIERPTTIVIRGISDFGDSRKASLDKINKGAIRRVAALNAIEFLFSLMHVEQLPRTAPHVTANDAHVRNLVLLDRTSRERCIARWESLRLDNLSQYAVSGLINQARVIARSWRNTRCHLFSRPREVAISQIEQASIPQLTELECLGLIRKISNDDRDWIINSYSESIRNSILRPLFAILVGVYRRDQNFSSPRSKADLFAWLSETALRNSPDSSDQVEATLRRLAVFCVDHRSEYVLNRDVLLTAREIDSLQLTGLVEVTSNGLGLRFVLPILKEWYAAQALIKGEKPTAPLASNPSLVESWRHPLAIAIGNVNFPRIVEIIRPIATQLPAHASLVVDEAIASWGHGEAVEAPLESTCIEQIEASMHIWAEGIGPLRYFLSAVDGNGDVKHAIVRSHGIRITTSWSSTPQTSQHIAPKLITGPGVISATQDGYRSASTGNSPGWAFRWTLEECADDLETLVDSKLLLPEDGAMRDEFAWHLLHYFGREIHDKSGELNALRAEAVNRYLGRGRRYISLLIGKVDAELIVAEIDRLLAMGQSHLVPPYPSKDVASPRVPIIHLQYSDDRLLELAVHVYSKAIDEYKSIVETYFQRFSSRLWHYSMMPFRYVGRLSRKPEFDLIQAYCLPLGTDAKSEVDIAYSTEPEPQNDNILDLIFQEYERVGRKDTGWLGATSSRGILDIFGQRPVTNVVYDWLHSDLHRVKWVKKHGPVRRAFD